MRENVREIGGGGNTGKWVVCVWSVLESENCHGEVQKEVGLGDNNSTQHRGIFANELVRVPVFLYF